MPTRLTDGPLRAGQKFGSYRVQAAIGQGPSFFAYHVFPVLGTGEYVLKILRPELASHPGWLDLFHTASEALIALEHPCAVRVYEQGVVAGQHYVLANYAGPRNIAWMLLNEGIGLSMALDVCRAATDLMLHCHQFSPPLFQYAFRPTDVFVGEGGRVLISDSSLLKYPTLTVPESPNPALGSVPAVECMAPELWELGHATIQSDLYSLGLLALRMLRGNQIVAEAAERLSKGEPVEAVLPKRSHRGLLECLTRALAHDPAERLSDALEFRAALDEADRETTRWKLGLGTLPWEAGGREPSPAQVLPPIKDLSTDEKPLSVPFEDLEVATVGELPAIEAEHESAPTDEEPPSLATAGELLQGLSPDAAVSVSDPGAMHQVETETNLPPSPPLTGTGEEGASEPKPEWTAEEESLLRVLSAVAEMEACGEWSDDVGVLDRGHPLETAVGAPPGVQVVLVAEEESLLDGLSAVAEVEACGEWSDDVGVLDRGHPLETVVEAPPGVQVALVAEEESVLRAMSIVAGARATEALPALGAGRSPEAPTQPRIPLEGEPATQPDLVSAEEELARGLALVARNAEWGAETTYGAIVEAPEWVCDGLEASGLCTETGIQPELVSEENELLLASVLVCDPQASVGWGIYEARLAESCIVERGRDGTAPSGVWPEMIAVEEQLVRSLVLQCESEAAYLWANTEEGPIADLASPAGPCRQAPEPLLGVQTDFVRTEGETAAWLLEAAREQTLSAALVEQLADEMLLASVVPPNPRVSDLRLLPPHVTEGRHAELMASLEAWTKACTMAGTGREYGSWPDEAPPLQKGAALVPAFPQPEVVWHPVGSVLEAVRDEGTAGLLHARPTPHRAADALPSADPEASESVLAVGPRTPVAPFQRSATLPPSDLRAQDLLLGVDARGDALPVASLKDLAGDYGATPMAELVNEEVIPAEPSPDGGRTGLLGRIRTAIRSAVPLQRGDELGQGVESDVEELRDLLSQVGQVEALLVVIERWGQVGPTVLRAAEMDERVRSAVGEIYGLLEDQVGTIEGAGASPEARRIRERLMEMLLQLAAVMKPG